MLIVAGSSDTMGAMRTTGLVSGTPFRNLFRACLVAVILSAGLHASHAWAAGSEEEARKLFADGIARFDAHEYDRALELFRSAYAAWKNPKILPNIGTSLVQLNRFAEAIDAYEEFLQQAPANDPQRPEVETALRNAQGRVGMIAIEVQGAASKVTLDGRELSSSALEKPVRADPGRHVVEAEGEGGPARVSVVVKAGETSKAELRVANDSAPEEAPAAQPAAASAAAEHDIATPEAGPGATPWIVGGIGVAGLAAAGIFYAMRGSAVSELEDECINGTCPGASQSTIDSARRYELLSGISLGVGVVGIGAAIYMFSTAKSPSESARGPVWNRADLRVGRLPGGTWFAVRANF